MIELRPEQRITVDKAKSILAEKNIVYIAAMMRTGKSIMGITTAYESGFKTICVLTKKNAIENIKKDVADCAYPIHVYVTNYEQAKKLIPKFDIYIIDEANEAAGKYPKPSKRATIIKELIGDKPVILMSGTPNPESFSQLYHQFWLCAHSPFKSYRNFYKWAKDFVKQYDIEEPQEDGSVLIKKQVKQRYIGGMQSNDYSEGLEKEIMLAIAPYMVYLSQEEAGFTSLVEEEILTVPIDHRIYKLMDILKRDKIYTMKSGDVILADSPVKMQSIFHQISSGTIKIDNKTSHIIDESKAWYVKGYFAGKKIGIFYKFIKEGELLRKVFPDNTDNDAEFNKHDHLTYICQIRSGRSGVNISSADALVMYNIDFSATSYWQGRERMGDKNRTKANKMYWLFSEHGFEMKVYKAVVKKKNYTVSHFKRDIKKWGLPKVSPQLNIAQ